MMYRPISTIQALVAPKAGGTTDYQLTTNQRLIPLVVTSYASVSRRNENAVARAAVKSNGFDIDLLGAVIPRVKPASTPSTGTCQR